MKKSVIYFPILLFIIFLVAGCNKYGSVLVQYPTVPQLELPKNVRSIAVINRSLPPKGTKESAWDQNVKNHLVGNDKIASDDALKGVFDRFNGVKGVSIVIPAKTRYYGTGTRVTPELLNWDLVKHICDENNADLLLVLETFDSQTDLMATTVNQAVGSVLNGQVPTPPRQFRVHVQCFWRLYDPVSRRVIDQYQTSNYLTVEAGATIGVPVAPPDALQNVAYNAGQEYISRFIPGYLSVRRMMYRKGLGREKQTFLTAYRKAEVANWDEALVDWVKLSNSTKRKNAGRASLNAAVANEVLGKFDTALSWAEKGYVDFGNKKARYYISQLKYRLNNEY